MFSFKNFQPAILTIAVILAIGSQNVVFGQESPTSEEQAIPPVIPQEPAPAPATNKEPAKASPAPVATREESEQKIRSEEEAKYRTLYSEEELVTAASLHEESILTAPAVTTVISAERLESLPYLNLNQILDLQAGIRQVSDTYGNREVAIRGFEYQRFMIDNVEVNSEYDGTVNWTYSYLPLHIIKKIEVVRGPLSSVYGENAYGGTVSITTKSAYDIDGTYVYGGLGSFRDKSSGILFGKTYGDFSLVFNYDFFTSDGPQAVAQGDRLTLIDQGYAYFHQFNAAVPTNFSAAPGPTNDWMNKHFAFLKANYKILEFTASYLNTEKGPYFGIFQALNRNSDFVHEAYLFNLKLDYSWFNTKVQWNTSYTRNKEDNYYDAFPAGFQLWTALGTPTPIVQVASYPLGVLGEDKLQTSSFGTNLKYEFKLPHNNFLTVGGEIKREDQFDPEFFANFSILTLAPYTSFQDVSNTPQNPNIAAYRLIQGAFLQDVWQVGKFGLTGGVRYDNYSDFGTAVSPRLVGVYSIDASQAIKVMYGDGFRPPTFKELYTQSNAVSLNGNPNLKPERLQTEEVRYEYLDRSASAPKRFSVGVFNNNAKDMIMQNNFTFPVMLDNISSVHSNGLEFEGEIGFNPAWDIFANYTYTNIVDEDTNTTIMQIPTHAASGGVTYRYQDYLVVTPVVLWVGITPRQRVDQVSPGKDTVLGTLDDVHAPDGIIDDPRPDHPGFSRMDLLIASGKYWKKVNARLSMLNLFNTTYTNPERTIGIPGDMPQPGRSIFLELRYFID